MASFGVLMKLARKWEKTHSNRQRKILDTKVMLIEDLVIDLELWSASLIDSAMNLVDV